MNEDMRNMFLAIGVSLLLVFAVQTFLPQIFPSLGPEPEPQVAPEQAGGDSGESNAGGLTVTGTDGESVAAIVTRGTALDSNERITIDTGVLTGSLNLTGAKEAGAWSVGKEQGTGSITTFGGPVEMRVSALTPASGNPLHQLVVVPTKHWLANDKISSTAAIASSKLAKPIDFADNEKARFGTSQDLEIYHDGNDSFIKDTGTGSLKIATNQLQVNNAADNEVMLSANQDGEVQLCFNGVGKLNTKSNGVTVTGEVHSTGLDVDGNADIAGTLTVNQLVVDDLSVTIPSIKLMH